MNGELQTLTFDNTIIPMTLDEQQISEIETTEIKEIKVSEARNQINDERFARLKKSLRKRSSSIL